MGTSITLLLAQRFVFFSCRPSQGKAFREAMRCVWDRSTVSKVWRINPRDCDQSKTYISLEFQTSNRDSLSQTNRSSKLLCLCESSKGVTKTEAWLVAAPHKSFVQGVSPVSMIMNKCANTQTQNNNDTECS